MDLTPFFLWVDGRDESTSNAIEGVSQIVAG
jgi:hypothetical protein